MTISLTSEELINFFRKKTNLEELDEIQVLVVTNDGFLSSIKFKNNGYENEYEIDSLIKDEIKREGVENENYTN